MASGGVLRTPGRAARGLIHWASELWPYVNGKALMSGIRLMEMEASDMLDCLHFLFEEDFTSVSEDHARSRSAIRDTLYNEMYGVSYTFRLADPKGKTGTRASNEFDYSEYEAMSNVEPFDPKKSDAFSSRDNSQSKKLGPSKAKFVDSSTIAPVEQSFEGIDGPLN